MDIEITIVIDINKRRTRPPEAIVQNAGLGRHVFKTKVSPVQVQPIAVGTCDIDIRQPVLVDITGTNTALNDEKKQLSNVPLRVGRSFRKIKARVGGGNLFEHRFIRRVTDNLHQRTGF